MQKPKAHKVAMAALKFPSNPSQGFDLTQSVIIQVTVSVTVFIKPTKSRKFKPTNRKYRHNNKSGCEIRNNRSGVLFQFVVQSFRSKSGDSDVLEAIFYFLDLFDQI